MPLKYNFIIKTTVKDINTCLFSDIQYLIICTNVYLWREWCWSWNSNTLATSCEELIHWKRPWCWEGLRAGEGDDRGWDDWIASPTQWTWVSVNSRSWWWTGRPGVLQFMGSQLVGHNWATELNWKCLSYNTDNMFQKNFLTKHAAWLLKELDQKE